MVLFTIKNNANYSIFLRKSAAIGKSVLEGMKSMGHAMGTLGVS
jgi:hypothetical protein